jgi:hypothetical protein
MDKFTRKASGGLSSGRLSISQLQEMKELLYKSEINFYFLARFCHFKQYFKSNQISQHFEM